MQISNGVKKIFLIIFSGSFILFPLFCSAAGLLPCGGQGEPSCQFCHFFILFKNAVDFLLFKIVPPLVALMIGIGGFMYTLAYFSSNEVKGKSGPALLSQANKLFMSVIWGLLIIFGAWVIVNTFFQLIGVEDWTGLKAGWWKIDCPVDSNYVPPDQEACDVAGGDCKSNLCSSYTDCSDSSGICQSGYCCLGSCETNIQETCSGAGGDCKPNLCSSYTDCSDSSSTCQSGYCCSGSCETNIQETCSGAGGECKPNLCSSYTSCSDSSGTCESGYCCLGICEGEE